MATAYNTVCEKMRFPQNPPSVAFTSTDVVRQGQAYLSTVGAVK
jgi:hypothetical protein